jgi:hypothetical protein
MITNASANVRRFFPAMPLVALIYGAACFYAGAPFYFILLLVPYGMVVGAFWPGTSAALPLAACASAIGGLGLPIARAFC